MQQDQGGGVRRHFNYSNVMSTLAVFLVVAGGTAMAAQIDGSKLEPGSVKNKALKADTVKSNKLKDGQAVANADVVPNSLTGTAINESTLTGVPVSGAAGGGLTGNYPNPTIANNAVGTNQLQDDAVTSAKIADANVNTADLADNAVSSAKIADGAVTSTKLATITEVSAGTGPVANNGTGGVTATCPAGTTVISGGHNPGNNSLAWRVQRSSRDGNGWRAFGTNQTGVASELFAKAYCLS